jgi:lipid II:glycine glycyltransferase (peptidoglycan interpeptide bridge formation enzyme)
VNHQPLPGQPPSSPEIEPIRQRERWDQSLLALPNAHVLQSWDWGEFKGRWGWQAHRLLWRMAGRPVAAAQLLRRRLPGTPWNFLYVSKGPVLDYGDGALVEQVLADLAAFARRNRALFIKIDPDVPRQLGPAELNAPLDPLGQLWLAILARQGWHDSPEQIQFRNTILLDLSDGPEQVLAGMKPKWRYNIRLAERKGVVIRSGNGDQELAIFYQMYQETAARDGFLIRPAAYYRDVWQRFIDSGQAELLLATVAGEVVAGLILFIFGPTAWYLYGASTGRHRALMPNHLLQWRAIERAGARGCRRYDLWGAPDHFAESDRLWGVYRFKQGFGGQLLHGLGAYDFPVNAPLYRLFSQTLPRFRAFLGRLKASRGRF